jgi:hypothetical protein
MRLTLCSAFLLADSCALRHISVITLVGKENLACIWSQNRAASQPVAKQLAAKSWWDVDGLGLRVMWMGAGWVWNNLGEWDAGGCK